MIAGLSKEGKLTEAAKKNGRTILMEVISVDDKYVPHREDKVGIVLAYCPGTMEQVNEDGATALYHAIIMKREAPARQLVMGGGVVDGGGVRGGGAL